MRNNIHCTFGNIPLDIHFDKSIGTTQIIHKNLQRFIVPRQRGRTRSPSLSIVLCPPRPPSQLDRHDALFLKRYFEDIFGKNPVNAHQESNVNLALAVCRHYYPHQRFREMVARARRSPRQWTIVNFTGCVLCIHTQSLTGTLFLDQDARASHQADVLNAAVCVASLAAPSYRSLFLHGTGLRIKNKGYLFLGRSGAGKSTVARLAGKHAVLSDDGIIVGHDNKGWHIAAAPLMQTSGSLKNKHSSTYGLAGIYFLHQASKNKMDNKSPAHGLSEILKYYVHFMRYFDIMESRMTFDISRRLVDAIACYTMYFQKNKKFLTLLSGR